MLSGIRMITNGNSIVIYIDEFTTEIKQEIRNRLVEICYGKANVGAELKAYSYQATVKEFVKRYKESADLASTRNKGMIGDFD